MVVSDRMQDREAFWQRSHAQNIASLHGEKVLHIAICGRFARLDETDVNGA